MQPVPYGRLADGRSVEAWTLQNNSGLAATIITYGARITTLHVPLPGGGTRNVVLGFKSLEEYEADNSHMGSTVGRFDNRIDHGRFVLDGHEYHIPLNDGTNALHGGPVGFNRAVWPITPEADNCLLLTHISPDGDQGFPGKLSVRMHYTLLADAFVIDYEAETDAPTVQNLTNHSYFNLVGSGDILGHVLTINADRFTPINAALIPLGEMRPVAGTPFDFRTPTRIGVRIDADDEQIRFGGGYDHNYVLSEAPFPEPRLAALLEAGGLVMEVLTTEPGIQFYSGNFLYKTVFPQRSALCLETQHFPDSPNQPSFPTTVLRPGEVFRSRTIYRFSQSA
jgi:aldose 1-epimerase